MYKRQAQLGFDIEAQTKAAIKELATALSKVSAEPVSYTHLDVYKRQV